MNCFDNLPALLLTDTLVLSWCLAWLFEHNRLRAQRDIQCGRSFRPTWEYCKSS